MKLTKGLQTQIEQVKRRMEMAIKNGHTKLADNEAKLLCTLTKIQPPKEKAEMPNDISQRRKERDQLVAELSAKLNRIRDANMAKTQSQK